RGRPSAGPWPPAGASPGGIPSSCRHESSLRRLGLSTLTRPPGSTRTRWAVLGSWAGLWLAAYWLNERIWTVLLEDVLHLDLGQRLPGAVEFFLYDAVKIGLLLLGLMFVVGLVNTQFTPERVREFLANRHFATALVL